MKSEGPARIMMMVDNACKAPKETQKGSIRCLTIAIVFVFATGFVGVKNDDDEYLHNSRVTQRGQLGPERL